MCGEWRQQGENTEVYLQELLGHVFILETHYGSKKVALEGEQF